MLCAAAEDVLRFFHGYDLHAKTISFLKSGPEVRAHARRTALTACYHEHSIQQGLAASRSCTPACVTVNHIYGGGAQSMQTWACTRQTAVCATSPWQPRQLQQRVRWCQAHCCQAQANSTACLCCMGCTF